MPFQADAFKHVLCMDLDAQRLSVAVIDKAQEKIKHHQEFKLDEFNREAIDPILKEELFKQNYAGICLTYGAERNTLIPVDLFNHSSAKDIFKLNFPEPHENIDYTRIPELGIVNISEVPIWIKSAFIVKIPRTKIIHRTTALLKGVFSGDTFKPQVHLHLNENDFHLMLADKRELKYYNRFDQAAVSDIIYHTLYVLEQKEWKPEETKFFIYGKSKGWEGLNELKKFIHSSIEIAQEPENSSQFILKNQLLCV